jgi:tetratricopeptide (TPR) repeat protein
MPGETGADLSKLEYEFATNPNSEAFIPLARAYLSMGRYVEAMVVCKRGIKAHPDLATGRLLMAQIYADQAKHQKAIEELQSLLKQNPENGDANRLMGLIHLKLSKQDEAVAYLKKALDSDPGDRQAKEALLKVGVDYVPVQSAPPPAPAAEIPPPQQRFTPAGGIARARIETPAGTPAGGIAAPRPTPASGIPTPSAIPVSERPTERSMPPVAPARPAPTPQRKRIADIYNEMEVSKRGHAHRGLRTTLILGGVLFFGFLIYVAYAYYSGQRQKEINTHVQAGRTFFNKDSFDGYQKALKEYRAIYKLDKQHVEALSRGAFICAVLFGEFGQGKDILTEGQKYLAEGQALEQPPSLLIAAKALLIAYGGGGLNEAVKVLEEALKKQDKSPVLQTALGMILMMQGKLADAKEPLLAGAGAGEIRAKVALGEWAMRRSMYREAVNAFSQALQSDRDHVRAILLSSLTLLLRGNNQGDNQTVATAMKRFSDELEKDASDREKLLARLIQIALRARNDREKPKALAELIDLAKKEVGNETIQFVAARELRRGGKLAEAKEAIERALRINSSRPDFALEDAEIALARGDFETARSRALRVQTMDPDSGLSKLLAGDAYRAEAHSDKVTDKAEKTALLDKAFKYYNEAKNSLDTEVFAHLRLGQLYLDPLKYDRDLAQEELGIAFQQLGPLGYRREAAEAGFLLAKIFAGKNLTDKFVAVLNQTMNLDPGYGPPFCLMGINIPLDNDDNRAKAKELCEKCASLVSASDSTACREVLKKVGGK